MKIKKWTGDYSSLQSIKVKACLFADDNCTVDKNRKAAKIKYKRRSEDIKME